MLKIQIKLLEIYLGVKFTDQIKFFLKFYLKSKNQSKFKPKTTNFTQKQQKINLSHIFYSKYENFLQQRLTCRIALCNDLPLQEGNNKFVGLFVIDFRKIGFAKQFPFILKEQVKIQNCIDPRAKICYQLTISQIPQLKFVKGLNNQDKNLQQNQLTEKDVQDQYQRQLLEQIRAQKQRLQKRKQKYLLQVERLKSQNQELFNQIQQQKDLFITNKALRQDKLQSITKKAEKTQNQYKKSKQNISQIFNIINQIGALDIVEGVTNILIE